MWKKKIMKKKMQFILIAVILMVSSFIFTICTNFVSTSTTYLNEYYSGENIMDMVLVSYDEPTTENFNNYLKWKNVKEDDIKNAEALIVDKQVYFGDESLEIPMATLIKYEDENSLPWEVVITDGAKEDRPKKGEIWISNLVADTKDINIGDKLKIKDGDNSYTFEVSALINDSLVPSTLMSLSQLYISKEDYSNFNNISKAAYIGYDTDLDGETATKDIQDYISDGVNGIILEKDLCIMAATQSSSLIIGVGLSTAILIFILSIIVIRFVLWSNILKEYKSIGVYKSLGFTSKQIRGIYLKSFGIVGSIAIAIGSLLSSFGANYLISLSTKYVGQYKGSSTNLIFSIITIVLMSIILLLSIYFALRKIDKIKPVEAFRVGVTSSKEKFEKSFIKDTSSPLSMAINDIFKHRKSNVIIIIVLLAVIYLSLFLVCSRNSIVNMDQNGWNIFGVVQGDVTLDFPSGEEGYKKALDELKNDSRVVAIREGSMDLGSGVYIDPKRYELKNGQIITSLYDSYENTDGFKASIIEGRNPKSKNEIAISMNILNDSGLKIGDYIEVKILGEEKKMLITGMYSSMMQSNYSVRITLDCIPKELLNTLGNLNISVVLKDKNDYESFKKDYKGKYPESSINNVSYMAISAGESIIEMARPIISIMLVAIILFSMLNIINILIMSNNDNRRNNAIMKSLGFSSSYIMKRTIYRISILTIISSIIAYILNEIISSKIMNAAMMGIDAMMINRNEVLITICIIAILTIVSAIVTMIPVRKISAVELMEE